MENIEFENQNRNRRYPFTQDSSLIDSNGKEFLDSFFVDAYLFVENMRASCRFIGFDSVSKKVTFQTDLGETTTGVLSDSRKIYLYRNGLHVGLVLLGVDPGILLSAGSFDFSEGSVLLSASCVFCTNMDYVKSITVNDVKMRNEIWISSKKDFLVIHNDSVTDPTTGKTYSTLRFDVLPVEGRSDSKGTPIKKIKLVCKKGSFFRLTKDTNSNILVTIASADRDDVCSYANGTLIKDTTSVIDTCEDTDTGACPSGSVPDPGASSTSTITLNVEDLDGSELNFVTYNLLNYVNPLNVSPVDGIFTSKSTPSIARGDSMGKRNDEVSKLTLDPVFGRGIKIGLPGLEKHV